MSRQATMNIGTIGHVAHGKTTLVRAITGIQTTKYKKEKARNITFKLGYANAKLFKCPKCPAPECYKSYGSEKEDNPPCETCGETLTLLRHVSFVDCPGHDILMATMLNGAAVMDAALLLISVNEPCPQPQTSEHLAAVENMDLKEIIIVQNKLDIVTKESAKVQFQQIKTFVQGTEAAKSPIIPVSAQMKYNVDVVIQALCQLPIPKRDFISPPRFVIVRSFDVNYPGTESQDLKGGVAGGTLVRGVLKLGQTIEIRPGIVTVNTDGKVNVTKIFSTIVSLRAEQNNIIYAIPGGLIGVGLKIDPFLTKEDTLVGQILGLPGKLPDIFDNIVVRVHLLRRLLGVRQMQGNSVREIKKGEVLLLNVGSTSMSGRALSVGGDNEDEIKFELNGPVCCEIKEKIAVSRKIGKSYRLIGWGEILSGNSINKES